MLTKHPTTPGRRHHSKVPPAFLFALALGFAPTLAFISGCSAPNPSNPTNPYYQANKAHHRPDGFVNSNGTRVKKDLADVLRWYQEHYGNNLPAPPSTVVQGYEGFAVTPFNRQAWQDQGPISATWLGHATVLLRINNTHVLTDPHFSKRASPVQWAGPQRKVKSPLNNIADLPRIDVVVISHNHHDHLDKDSIVALAKQQPMVQFLVPLGVEKTLQSWGIQRVTALDWWDNTHHAQAQFTLVPAQHWSSRSLLDANETLWGGWVVVHPAFRFYFSGDTGYNPQDFKEIGQRLGPFDLSAIAVGAYEPRWFMQEQHINPDEAVQVHLDVGSRQSIGVHWGTFELTDEALDQPLVDLELAKKRLGVHAESFLLLKHGESWVPKVGGVK